MKKLMKFLKSGAGRKFYNFAYCWGACFVILGAVFKIAHMPFDNILLMVGMFTEVFIFFISAFDNPEEYKWENVFPALIENDGKDVGESLDIAWKEYSAGVKTMENRMNEMNTAFEEQTRRMKSLTEAMDPASLENMKAATVEMTRLLKELNMKYSVMLEVFSEGKRK